MSERYDFEQAIMVAWQTSDDLDLLYKHHGDHPFPMTEDQVATALLGIKALHDMRMEKLMDMYCRKFELNQYCTDPVKLAAREGIFDLSEPKKKKGSKK